MTPAEQALWALLRNRQVEGAKFRRQHPLGVYYADFYCESAALVVEADGAPHFPPPARDRFRDSLFEACGILVLRFENCEILENPDGVLSQIRQAIRERRQFPR
jgi:very-short-patch-repair endonuclease